MLFRSFPPLGFLITNPDNADTWISRTVTGPYGSITTAAYVDNYNYNAPGQEDYLETRVYDLTGISNAYMTFDLAYAAYSTTYEDGLRVDISTDCGGTFIPTGYLKQGLTLSTIPNYNTNASWQPASASEWRRDTVNLTAFSGQPVILRFANINGYGNSMHIDNINVSQGTVGVNDITLNDQFIVYPNPANEALNIYCNNASNEMLSINVFDASGRLVMTTQNNFAVSNVFRLDMQHITPGVYNVEISGNKNQSNKRVIIY